MEFDGNFRRSSHGTGTADRGRSRHVAGREKLQLLPIGSMLPKDRLRMAQAWRYSLSAGMSTRCYGDGRSTATTTTATARARRLHAFSSLVRATARDACGNTTCSTNFRARDARRPQSRLDIDPAMPMETADALRLSGARAGSRRRRRAHARVAHLTTRVALR